MGGPFIAPLHAEIHLKKTRGSRWLCGEEHGRPLLPHVLPGSVISGTIPPTNSEGVFADNHPNHTISICPPHYHRLYRIRT